MKNNHEFTIEQIEISPVNIGTDDEKGIRQTISKLARGHIQGETEIEVFKKFASALERTFGAQRSTFSPPSSDYKHWRIHLPKDGDFDSTHSRFSVSFHINRVDSEH